MPNIRNSPTMQRLGVDSMKRFDACTLCLQQAREPVACGEGHLYCKECIYTDLLSQKKDIKRFKAKLEELQREEEAEKARAAQAARDRVLRDFERNQLGLASRKEPTNNKDKGKDQAKDKEAENGDGPRGTKRPASTAFEFDLDHAEELARRAEAAALKQLEIEQKEARKSKLPSAYWLASETPTAEGNDPEKAKLKDMKVGTLCRASEFGHPLNLKGLIPVKFTIQSNGESTSAPSKDNSECICPSCKKTLNLGVMFLMRPCSHVLCKTCTDTLVTPNKQCVVCDSALPNPKDIIQLCREGTGYSGGGRAETKKIGVSFQG
ncbi:RING finger protein [Rhizoctonia solani]|uniref:RING finger protein n=2 Tax=Rhizoctonia solani TaxID=456999 RepID=A0A8H8T2N2_9AGAM|nr:RING finger protein [Rhizoctonia solani]QRW27059.1 RING finger protein [Rhizoctonia solani]